MISSERTVSNLHEMRNNDIRRTAGANDRLDGLRKLDIVARNHSIIAAVSLKGGLHEIVGKTAVDFVTEEADRRLWIVPLGTQ